MSPIRIELLGRLRITLAQQPLASVNTNRLQSLLAFLVLNSGAPQSREHLAFLLWPESGESQARTNLRQLLYHLRRALPAECTPLTIDNRTVHWRTDAACSIDVIDFEAATARAGGYAEKKGDLSHDAPVKLSSKRQRLYQDDLLPDLYDDWLQTRREQLRQQFAEVLGRLATLLDLAREYPAGLRYATRLVAIDPLREASYQTLMRLHLRNHDRSSALRVYHECMRNLQRELGVSPSKATQDLFTQALKSEPPGAPAERPPFASTVPLPMVGRKTEWERLLGCWRLVAQGEAHFALILGEPGIGKSRLADELFQSCSRYFDHAAARARCYFAQGQLAYGPVTEWLRAEPMRSVRSQLPKPQLVELARVLPEILLENPEIPAPQPLTESWQRRHFYEALNAVFRKARKPLLLLIDDLQWCDRDSFEWLHSLFRSDALGRPRCSCWERCVRKKRGADHPLSGLVRELQQSGRLSEFPIAPLSVDETAALAAQVATKECDPAFLSGLHQATGGNPLFVVESVRASLEDQPSRGATPPRVQAVIAARLAQLSPSAYELAGLAATIGRPFSMDLLAKATDWDEDSLSRSLEELWQRRIIDGQGAGSYDYTHDLLRDVAYAELSPIRRRSWHRRIARAMEEMHGPEAASVSRLLAAHYEAAGMVEQAILVQLQDLLRMSQGSGSRMQEAADLIRRALSLCHELPETAKRDRQELDLLVALGPSLVTTQGYSMPEVGETYERGLLLSQRAGEYKHSFSLLSGAWVFNIVSGRLEESRRVAQDSVDAAQLENAFAQQMASQFLLGTSLFHLGQFEASRQQIEQAVAIGGGLSHAALTLFAGPNIDVFCRSYLSHLFCLFGQAAVRPSPRAAKPSRGLAQCRIPSRLGSRSITRRCWMYSARNRNRRWPRPGKPRRSAANMGLSITRDWPIF